MCRAKRSAALALPVAVRDAIDDQRYQLMRGCAVLESLAVTLRRDGDDLEPRTAADAMQVVIDMMQGLEKALSADSLGKRATL